MTLEVSDFFAPGDIFNYTKWFTCDGNGDRGVEENAKKQMKLRENGEEEKQWHNSFSLGTSYKHLVFLLTFTSRPKSEHSN